MNSLFSMFFGRNSESEDKKAAPTLAPYQGMLTDDANCRKRSLEVDQKGSGQVPTLVPSLENGGERPVKRFRGERRTVFVTASDEETTRQIASSEWEPIAHRSLLEKLPEDAVAHCLSFLGGVEDRFALQCTSKQFQKISNTAALLKSVAVGGDKKTGLHGIIQDSDTPESATILLAPFATAGNMEAVYM
jgi:hypothetical protein